MLNYVKAATISVFAFQLVATHWIFSLFQTFSINPRDGCVRKISVSKN